MVSATDRMAALGDVTRRSIVEILTVRPSSVADIARQLPVSRSAVSQHLRVLKDVGLVKLRNEGTRNIYQLVRKSVLVNASQAHAFAVFTEQIGTWWPLKSHHIGADPAETAIIEPKVGGRWFERSRDGAECDWGRVLIWEPPHRIVSSWDIGCGLEVRAHAGN